MSNEQEIQSPRVGRAAPADKPRGKPGPKPKAAAIKEHKAEVQDEPAEPVRAARPEATAEEPRRTRRSRAGGGDVALDVPEHMKKTGWDYEWKTTRVMGADVDGYYSTFYREQGWEVVPADEMPDMIPVGSTARYIERFGQILMMRPDYLTQEAKEEALTLAETQKHDKLMASSALEMPKNVRGMRATAPEISIQGEVGSHRAKPNAA